MDRLDLEAEARLLFKKAQEMLAKDGSLMPHVIADCTALPQRTIIPLNWKNEVQKQGLCLQATEYLKKNDCTFYALITDVWVVPGTGSAAPATEPAQDPAREPAIMLRAAVPGTTITLLGTGEGDPEVTDAMIMDLDLPVFSVAAAMLSS